MRAVACSCSHRSVSSLGVISPPIAQCDRRNVHADLPCDLHPERNQALALAVPRLRALLPANQRGFWNLHVRSNRRQRVAAAQQKGDDAEPIDAGGLHVYGCVQYPQLTLFKRLDRKTKQVTNTWRVNGADQPDIDDAIKVLDAEYAQPLNPA